MKHGVYAAFLVLSFSAAVSCVIPGVGPTSVLLTGAAEAAPPPLIINKDKPLLLEEPKPAEPDDPWAAPEGPVADNQACFVCHENYKEEPMAADHAKVNVGCVKCHGESLEHRDDEDNITPPDIMYPPEKIEPSCVKCHKTHLSPPGELIARWQERCPAKTDPKTIVCTDCHGQHRLKLRTVWWDKKTRKLIIREKGERTEPADDLTKEPKTDPKKQ